MDEELELGLPPSRKRPRAAPGSPKPNRTWSSYKAKSPHPCELCVEAIEKVNNFPVRAVNRAMFVEHGPDGNVYLCAGHKQDRESLYAKEER